MDYKIDRCPVCSSLCTTGEYDFGDKKEVICERCGNFKISLFALSVSEINKYKNGRSILSYYIRNFYDSLVLLDNLNINSILKSYQLPNYDQKKSNILNWIAKASEFSTKSVRLPNENERVSIWPLWYLLRCMWCNRLWWLSE